MLRPRLPSTGRLSKPGLPPTSWTNQGTNNGGGGTRTRTVGSSTFSINTTLSEGVFPRRPFKLARPSSSGFRDSSGSLAGNNNERTSSSTIASTLSTGIPSTPRDYDPSLSSPAGLFCSSMKSYNMEKSLPPLPKNNNNNSLLRKRPSNHNLSNFNFLHVRTSSSTTTTSSVPSPSSPLSSSAAASPVHPLQLPRQAARVVGGGKRDRAAVSVPSVLSSSQSSPFVCLRQFLVPHHQLIRQYLAAG